MPLVNFAVSGAGTGVAQTVAVKGAEYTIETDAYEAFGGKDEYPARWPTPSRRSARATR